MLGALVYLRFTSFKNWGLTRLKSLRRPKQLAGALMFGLYFWFFFLRHWQEAPAPRVSGRAAAEEALEAANATLALPADWLPVTTALGALLLLALAALLWIVPTQRAALGFSEAEIAFLFPAPVKRRTLVHFRLLSAQFRSLVGATIMTLISNRWSFLGGNALTHALGWWFVFSALNLHYHGATFTLTRLGDAGFGTLRRRLAILFLVAGLVALTAWRLPAGARLPAGDALQQLRPFADWVVAFAHTAPLRWALLPFEFVLGPFLAVDGRAFLLALAPALVVIVVHYLWVVRTALAFEDDSIEHAQKRTARIEAWRSGHRRMSDAPAKAQREPFRLGGTGRSEIAFLWKNLLSTWPYFNVRVFLGCAVAIVAAGVWLHVRPGWSAFAPPIGFGAAVFAAYLLTLGPQFARQDLRSDLVHADILKTYPLPGWRIVLGELLAPVAILTGLLWLALLTTALTFQPARETATWLTPQFRIVCALWLALLAPVLTTLQLLVPNAAALLFPAWFQASRTRGGGPEVAGQRMIFLFAQVLTMALALLPPVGFGALLIFILQSFAGATLAVSAAALVVLSVLVGEVACGLWLLGDRFEKFDLSAELRS